MEQIAADPPSHGVEAKYITPSHGIVAVANRVILFAYVIFEPETAYVLNKLFSGSKE